MQKKTKHEIESVEKENTEEDRNDKDKRKEVKEKETGQEEDETERADKYVAETVGVEKDYQDTEEGNETYEEEQSVELNSIVNYAEASKFVSLTDPDRGFWQCFSLKEDKAESLGKEQDGARQLVILTQTNLARVYPKGSRINSDNYNPVPYWLRGFQLAAMNQQTHDEGSAINTAFFGQNGGCGYVLKPEYMLRPAPIYSPLSLTEESQEEVTISLLAGHQLGQGQVRVGLRLLGHPHDETSWMSSTTQGANCSWGESCQGEEVVLTVRRPHLALLEVKLYTEEGAPAASYTALPLLPVGYRSLKLAREKGRLPPRLDFRVARGR